MFTSRDHAAVCDPGAEAGTWVVRADGFGAASRASPSGVGPDCGSGSSSRSPEASGPAPAALARVPSAPDLVHAHHRPRRRGPRPRTARRGVPGHVFWDELFVLPLLNYRLPILTRSLLEYRHRRLRAARVGSTRRRAIGERCSRGRVAATGGRRRSEFHLNPRPGAGWPITRISSVTSTCAIAYNVWQYFQVTGDLPFLRYHGAELIVEIARSVLEPRDVRRGRAAATTSSG